MNEQALHLKWVHGKCNKDVHFITENEMVLVCGSCIKTRRTDVEQETAVEGPPEGIQCLTADHTLQLLAVSDLSEQTSIYIIEYSTFKILSQLKSSTFCEFKELHFAGSEHLFALETYPNYTITLYNWKARQQIKEIQHPFHMLSTLSFKFKVHPFYNNISCFQQGIAMHFYEIEDIFQNVQLEMHTVYMPKLGDIHGLSILAEKEVGNLTWFDKLLYDSWGIHSRNLYDLPLEAICEDMSDIELVQFYDDLVRQERLAISCHCWLPYKDVIVSCTNGSVVTFSFKGSFKKYLNYSIFTAANYDSKDIITSMALNSIGLFAAKNNGDVFLITDIDEWLLVKQFSLDGIPVSMKFSPNFLDIFCVAHTGSVWSCNVVQIESKVSCLVPEISGDILVIGICIIDDSYLMMAKENGRIDVLDINNGKIISYLDIEEKLEFLEGSPMCSIVLLATANFHLYIVNASDITNLRVIKKIRLCDAPIVKICIENFGRYALLLSRDQKVFLINILPSKEFQVLGYFTLMCEVKSMGIFTKGSDSPSSIFLLCCPIKDSWNDNYLLTLKIPKDFEEYFNQYWEDESGILDTNAFDPEELVIGYPCSNLAVHYHYGILFSNVLNNKVENICVNFHNNFQENIPIWNEELVSSLDNSRLVLSASHDILFVLLENGEIFMSCIKNPNDIFKIYTSFTDNYGIRLVKCSWKDEYIFVVNKFGLIKCYDISQLKNEFSRQWILFCEQTKETENEKLSEIEPIVDYENLTSWSTLMVNKLNSEVISSLKKENEEFQIEILALRNLLDYLVNENRSILPQHQNAIEEFILDEGLKETLLKERDNILKDYEYFLRDKLSRGLKSISEMEKECFVEMKEKCKIIKPLKEGQLLNNYSIPKFTEIETQRMNYAYKVSQVNECIQNLILNSTQRDFCEKLKFSENGFSEEENIGSEFRQYIFVLQGQEERVNYAYILQYVVFRKRLAFNKLFDKLEEFKNESITSIKTINERISVILEQIDEEREIWSPVNETFNSYFEITEQDIEQNTSFNSEEYSTKPKGLADNFLNSEWLLKLLNPSDKINKPKLKPEVISKLRKELDKLLNNSTMLINEYDNKHNLLIENKFKWDINIILDELQLFLICLSNSNTSYLNSLESDIKNVISNLYLQISSTESLVSEMEDAIENNKKTREKICDGMNEIYDDVEYLSKVSRNKELFLEAFSKRPPTKLTPKTNNPYQITSVHETVSFQDLNSLKPRKTPVNVWKEMCILRENISIIENDLKRNEGETEEFSRKKSKLISKQNSLHSKITYLSNYRDKMYTQHLQSMFDVPMVILIECSQLEMKYPDHLSFQKSLFIRKSHLESLNKLLSGVGSTKLDLVQKQARAEFRIEKNQAKVRKINLELGNLKTDMETVESIPMGRELQNLLQDPESFFPGKKMGALEKSGEQERAEIERQIKQVDENASRIKQKMENLRRGTQQRQKEIEVVKGNLAELHKLGDEK